jgi:L-alanine-DL-glutamate epimerase-like enolase superfamily enzyme
MNLVRVVDGDGRAGYASTWLPGGRHDVVDAIAQFLRPVVVGRTVAALEEIHRIAERAAYFIPMRAAWSALDIALWDLAAKTAELPLCDFLGRRRDSLPVYASASPQPTPDDAAAAAVSARDRGLHGFKLHVFNTPGLDIEACRAMRAAVGAGLALILDPVNSYERTDALEVGHALDQLDFAWYEAPLPDDDVEGYVDLARAIEVPIANGEVRVRGLLDYRELLRQRAVDIVRCAADVQGGLTVLRRAGDLAQSFGCRLEPRSYGSTLVQAAHLHWSLSVTNCKFFEVPEPRGTLDFGMANVITADADGYVRAPTGPGLGIEIDWDAIDDATILRG